MNMNSEYVYQPVRFFLIVFLITWISGFIAAYLSYQTYGKSIYMLFMLPGLLAPFGTSLWMILSSKSKELKKSFFNKLTNLRLINLSSLFASVLIMPSSVVISILISLLFGQSISQLNFADKFSFSAGFALVLLVLALPAIFEELGWRSYATDSLSSTFNYFTATVIFAALCAFWHFPLFFVHDYYQELVRNNILFAINFVISVFPTVFIINWLCSKNSGSILITMLFHFFINISQEALQMGQIAKCIQTVVLTLIAALIVIFNKKMFFNSSETSDSVSSKPTFACEMHQDYLLQ